MQIDDLLRAPAARGDGQLLHKGELLLPHAGGHPADPFLPQQLDALPLGVLPEGEDYVAAAAGIEGQIGPGEHLSGIEYPGVNAPQLPPDVQELADVLRSLPAALEGHLKAEGAGALPLLGYVEHGHVHRAAGAEAAISAQLPAGEVHRAHSIDDAGDVRAAVRDNVLPRGLAGEGLPCHRLIEVVTGCFQVQFHSGVLPRMAAGAGCPATVVTILCGRTAVLFFDAEDFPQDAGEQLGGFDDDDLHGDLLPICAGRRSRSQ